MDVVALSGGKDSSAMALLLRDREPRDYVYVCTPTGDELPEWWHHMRTMRDLLGKPVIPVVGGTLKGLCDKWQALPNWRQRWCTRKLKIEPFAAWLMQQPRPIVSYVGLRADEPERDGGDYSAVPGVDIRYPLREWGVNEADVLAYLEQRGVSIPERTDCARCFYQTLGEWWRLWKDHPEIYADAEAQEAAIGHTWRSPGRDDWPTSLADLRADFERGKVPRGNPGQRDLFKAMQCRVCRM